jgi:hypothetical protein
MEILACTWIISDLSLRNPSCFQDGRSLLCDEAICSSIRCHCEERISVLCWQRSNLLNHPLSLRGAHQRFLLATKQSAHPSVVIARSASAFFCWRRSNLLIHPLSLRGAHQRSLLATKQSAHPSVVIARSTSAFFAGDEAICSSH